MLPSHRNTQSDIAEAKEEAQQPNTESTEKPAEQKTDSQNVPQSTQQNTGEYGGWDNIINIMGMNGAGDTFNISAILLLCFLICFLVS